MPDPFARLAADRGIFARGAGEIFWKLGFAARMPEMVKGDVGGDAPRPGAKIAGRFESRSGPVDAPESFHGQILGNAGITDDANNPGIDFLLVLAKESLEGFEVARREPFQQFHLPLSTLNYWRIPALVTSCFAPGSGNRDARHKEKRPGGGSARAFQSESGEVNSSLQRRSVDVV